MHSETRRTKYNLKTVPNTLTRRSKHVKIFFMQIVAKILLVNYSDRSRINYFLYIVKNGRQKLSIEIKLNE